MGYFIPWYKTIDSSLTTSDEQGNIVLQTKNLRFKKPFYIEYDSDTDEANVNLGDVPFLFNDKITKKIIQSNRGRKYGWNGSHCTSWKRTNTRW